MKKRRKENKMVKVGSYGICAIQKEISVPKTEVGKTIGNKALILRENIISPVNSYFPIRGHSLTPKLHTCTLYMETYSTKFKLQNIKNGTTTEASHLTISKLKLLMSLNRFYMAIVSPSASAVVYNI